MTYHTDNTEGSASEPLSVPSLQYVLRHAARFKVDVVVLKRGFLAELRRSDPDRVQAMTTALRPFWLEHYDMRGEDFVNMSAEQIKQWADFYTVLNGVDQSVADQLAVAVIEFQEWARPEMERRAAAAAAPHTRSA